MVDLDAKVGPLNAAVLAQIVHHLADDGRRNGKRVSSVASCLRRDGGVDANQFAVEVDQRDPGVRVAGVFRGSGASAAGLQPGDRIEAIDGISVSTFPALQEQLSKHRPGARIAVQLRRDGRQLQKEVELQGRNALVSTTDDRPATRTSSEEDFLPNWGVRLSPATAQVQARLDVRGGLVVTDMRPGEWSDEGIRRGAVLLRVDGQPLESEDDLNKALDKAREAGQRGGGGGAE